METVRTVKCRVRRKRMPQALSRRNGLPEAGGRKDSRSGFFSIISRKMLSSCYRKKVRECDRDWRTQMRASRGTRCGAAWRVTKTEYASKACATLWGYFADQPCYNMLSCLTVNAKKVTA